MELVSMLVPLAPRAMVLVAGLVFAMLRWRRHPTASMLVASGCVLELMTAMGSTALSLYVTRSGVSWSGMSMMWLPLSLVGDLGLGLMLAAPFVERPPK